MLYNTKRGWIGAIFLFLLFFSSNNISAQCAFKIVMNDSWGDGWSGNSVDIEVGGLSSNYTLNYGAQDSATFFVSSADSIFVTFLDTGTFAQEVSFDIKDADGTVIFSSGTRLSGGMLFDTLGYCPPCISVTNMAVSSRTTSSLNLSWNSTGASSYDLTYGPCGFDPLIAGITVSASTNSIVLSGLTGSTCYEVYITSDCTSSGNGYSVQSGPFRYNSGSITVSSFPYFEDFELSAGGFVTTGANSSWEWGAPNAVIIDSAHSGSNAWVTGLDGKHNLNELSYLVSPIFDLSLNQYGVKLEFEMHTASEDFVDGASLELTSDGVNWVKVSDNGNSQNWYNNTLDEIWDGDNGGYLSTSILLDTLYAKSHVQFRFVFESDGVITIEGAAIDDVQITELPCSLPSGVSLADSTKTSLTLNWISSAGSSTIEWGETGFTRGTGAVMSGLNSQGVISGLQPGTTYDIYLRDSCGPTALGLWVGPFTYTTAQDTIRTLPYFESFEATGGGWITSGSSNLWEWGYPQGRILSYGLRGLKSWGTNLDGSYGSNELAYLITPVFDFSSYTSVIELSFYSARDFPAFGDGAYLEMTTNGSTWHKVVNKGTATNWYSDTTNQWFDGVDTNPTQSVFVFDSLAGKSYVQFRFVLESNGFLNNDGMTLDAFRVEELSCSIPSKDSIRNISSTSATLYFTSNSTGVNIEYGPRGFALGGGSYAHNISSPHTLSRLSPGTDYDVYFQDSCGVGSTGPWVGPYSFSTVQDTIRLFPYLEDFESGSGGWITAGTNSSWEWGTPNGNIFTTAGQGLNSWVTNLNGNYNANELSYLYSPTFDFTSKSNDMLYEFLMIFETEDQRDEGWVEYTTDGTTWVKLVDIGQANGWYNDPTTNSWMDTDGAWSLRSNIVPGSAGQKVQFRHVIQSDNFFQMEGFGLDSIYISEVLCANPSNLSASNVDSVSATLKWDGNGASYLIEYGIGSFRQGSGTNVSSTADSILVTGLMNSTNYCFYVAQICASGDTSVWSGPHCFDTECAAFLGDDYQSAIPMNGTSAWTGDASKCFTDAVSLRAGVDVVFEYTASAVLDSVRFETCGSLYNTYLYVINADTTTQLASNDDACRLQSVIVTDSIVPGNTYFVVVEAFSSFTLISNLSLSITEYGTCPTPSAVQVTNSSCTSVDLSWRGSAQSSSYIIEYGVTNFRRGSGLTVLTSSTSETIGGLSPGTAYDFYISSACVNDSSSATLLTDSTLNGTLTVAATRLTLDSVNVSDADVTADASASIGDSVSVDFGDSSPIQWGTNLSHSYSSNGTYYVTTVAYGICGSDTVVDTLVIQGIEIDEYLFGSFGVYPNPSDGMLIISIEDGFSKNALIEVVSIDGRVLYSIEIDLLNGSKEVQMDLSSLSSGTYVIRYRGDVYTAHERVFIH